jgi:flagellar protein FliL
MAKAPGKEGAKKSGGGISLLGILIITFLAVGAGGFFGMQVPGLTKTGPDKPKAAAVNEHEQKPPSTALVQPLPPITTNLAQPSTTWIRIESSVVINADMGPDAKVIAARMSEDIIGYLRTLSIDQIEGPSGFQHLREDLNDRVRVRSEGKASELIIQSLILE